MEAFSKMSLMRNPTQSRELAIGNEKLEKQKKSFIYDKDDEFYSAPAFCHLLHYRNAAVFCGILEIFLLVIAILVFLSKLLFS